MSHRLARTLRLPLILLAGFFAVLTAHSQSYPTANTFSSIAGGYTGTYSGAGVPCGGATSGSTYVTTDTYGNGCPGQYAKFGTELSGMGVDGAGNVYVMDTTYAQVRKIDAKSGIVTRVAGAGTNCGSASGQLDAYGAGCPLLQTALPASTYVRGMNVDYYGNILIPAYSGSVVEIACMTQSPLCPIAAGATNSTSQKQVGYLYRVAGCVASATGSGASESTTAYSGGDGTVASPFENLAGDVSATTGWGSGTTGSGTCSSTIGSVSQPRNAIADKYGNVWIADTGSNRYRVVLGPKTSTFFSGNNPMYAIIQMNPNFSTAHYGYIYPILGTFTSSGATGFSVPTAASASCGSYSSATSTDAVGDGCPWPDTTTGSSVAGLTVDYNGNVIFFDNAKQLIRVLYVQGTAMANIIQVTNPTLTATPGYVYSIGGFGTGSTLATTGTTPTINEAASSFSYDVKGAVDRYGNIYIGNNSPLALYVIDATTGYFRQLFQSGSACGAAKDTIGDGCPIGSAPFVSAGSSVGMPIGIDNLNNIYLADNQGYIRKVLATTLYPTAIGSSFAQNLLFHEPVGTTSITASLLDADTSITLGTTSCVLNTTNSDNTADCTVPITFAPTTTGQHQATLVITNTGGTAATNYYTLSGKATGSVIVEDGVATPSTSTFNTTSLVPSALAIDGAHNLYAIDKHAGAVDQISPSGVVTSIGSSYPTTPTQLAVDPYGNIYMTGTGTANIYKLALSSSGYTASTVTSSVAAAPQAITFDSQGNMYVADGTTKNVYEVPVDGVDPGTNPPAIATGLNNPVQLVIDGNGNLLIGDIGNEAVYRVNISTGAMSTIASAAGGTNIVKLTGLVLAGLASDSGGDIYIQDGSTGKTFEIPYQTSGTATAAATTIYSGQTNPGGIVVDGTGILYAADATANTITALARNNESYAFGNNSGTANYITGTLTNVGNATASGSSETTATASQFLFDSSTSGVGASTCGTIPSSSASLYPGQGCTFTTYFSPAAGSNNVVSASITPLPTGSLGGFTVSGIDPVGTTLTTTTAVSGPSSAVYASSGTEATLTVTVTNTSGTNTDTPTGTVSVSINGGAGVAYNLSAASAGVATATVPVTGLTVGSYSIAASYGNTTDTNASNTSFGASNGSASLGITQASTSISWTPGSTSTQYSAAIGSSILNATSATPGVLVYTATPSGGSAQNITSSSYLARGTYTLGVTLVPADSVDYAQSKASVSGFTVTQATTSAPIGTTQTLVAADGTGNYTSVQSAVNALPSGGNIYIKPGTYQGFITVVQPNISLRGLGGDPTKVILTHEAGAFGSTYPYTGEFQQTGINTNNGGSNGWQLPSGSSIFTGDEGSATLVAAKGINTALSTSSQMPNNFFAEYLTLANAYDTDTTTTTTTYEGSSGGTCATNQGPAQTYSALYNLGTLCGSQALAIWTTSDLQVMNNVYTTSLQDTIYSASQGQSGGYYVPARQYWFRGKITGDVDFIFGDGAAVFDSTSIYTAWHGNTATGTETIHAQEKFTQTGSSTDYLSGYIVNNGVLTSQSTGMTSLYFGRPYGTYSTWVMLNTYADQVNATGYTTGLGPSLVDTTFLEYGDIPYTDPATNGVDINGIPYLGAAGNTGTGVTGTRETSSTNPGTPESGNGVPTSMTQAQAQAYFPNNWLSQTVTNSSTSTTNWIPTTALANQVNAFTGSGTSASVTARTPVTILMHPSVPGLGAIVPSSYSSSSPGSTVWTIPTGTWKLYDNGTQIATGSLDASGEAYYTTTTLSAGSHPLTWTYSGDANFAGSTTSTAYNLTITASNSAVALSGSGVTYGQSATITATVTSTAGTPNAGTVILSIDGTSSQSATVNSSGVATFTVSGLAGGSHTFNASYSGSGSFTGSSTTSSFPLTISPATLTITGTCSNRVFGAANSCTGTVTGYQYSDSAATAFSAAPTGTTTATRDSIAGSYTASVASYTLSTAGAADYTVTTQTSGFSITGGAPQKIIFPALPNFPHGASYQLTARTTSGLTVNYTVTTGNSIASISGSTLTVTGTGPVTVQASSVTDPTGDYAAATSVSESFTAQ